MLGSEHVERAAALATLDQRRKQHLVLERHVAGDGARHDPTDGRNLDERARGLGIGLDLVEDRVRKRVLAQEALGDLHDSTRMPAANADDP